MAAHHGLGYASLNSPGLVESTLMNGGNPCFQQFLDALLILAGEHDVVQGLHVGQ